jgi:hypothetical protein
VRVTTSYNPIVPPREDWLLRRVEALERQVRELQAARVIRSSLSGGEFAWADSSFTRTDGSTVEQQGGWQRWKDAAGTVRRGVGYVDRTGQDNAGALWGDWAMDQYGALGMGMASTWRGLAYPPVYLSPHRPDVPGVAPAVTGTTWTTMWKMRADDTAMEVVELAGWAEVPVGSNGQLRLMEWFSGQTLTSVIDVLGNTHGWWRFAWLHPGAVGWGDDRGRDVQVEINVQGRVSVGSGSLLVWPTEIALLSSRMVITDAASDGHPSYTP